MVPPTAFFRSMKTCWVFTAPIDPLAVVFCDPRDVLEAPAAFDRGRLGAAVSVSIPESLARNLQDASMQIGDHDEPENSWVVGQVQG